MTYNVSVGSVSHGHSCKSRTGGARRAPTLEPRAPLPRARTGGNCRRHAARRAAPLGSAWGERPRGSAVHLLTHGGRTRRVAIEPRSRLLDRPSGQCNRIHPGLRRGARDRDPARARGRFVQAPAIHDRPVRRHAQRGAAGDAVAAHHHLVRHRDMVEDRGRFSRRGHSDPHQHPIRREDERSALPPRSAQLLRLPTEDFFQHHSARHRALHLHRLENTAPAARCSGSWSASSTHRPQASAT